MHSQVHRGFTRIGQRLGHIASGVCAHGLVLWVCASHRGNLIVQFFLGQLSVLQEFHVLLCTEYEIKSMIHMSF